jgi:hypothetical protein
MLVQHAARRESRRLHRCVQCIKDRRNFTCRLSTVSSLHMFDVSYPRLTQPCTCAAFVDEIRYRCPIFAFYAVLCCRRLQRFGLVPKGHVWCRRFRWTNATTQWPVLSLKPCNKHQNIITDDVFVSAVVWIYDLSFSYGVLESQNDFWQIENAKTSKNHECIRHSNAQLIYICISMTDECLLLCCDPSQKSLDKTKYKSLERLH